MKTALLDSVEHQDSELVVLEGPAAASAVRTLRDRQTQALLPMQGKVPNATRVSWRKLSQHSQIADLLQSLHPQRCIESDFSSFRYQRVVLLNDPDVDGMHAGMLLVLFLYKYLPELIKQGRLYSAQVPLYGFYKDGKCLSHAFSDDQRDVLSAKLADDGAPAEVRRFKSVASVDRQILLHCLAPGSGTRRQLSFGECERLCSPFEK